MTPAIVSGTLINVFTLPFPNKPRYQMIGLCSAMLTLEQKMMMKIKMSKSRMRPLDLGLRMKRIRIRIRIG